MIGTVRYEGPRVKIGTYTPLEFNRVELDIEFVNDVCRNFVDRGYSVNFNSLIRNSALTRAPAARNNFELLRNVYERFNELYW